MNNYDFYNPIRLSEHFHPKECYLKAFSISAVSSEYTYGFETHGWMGRLAASGTRVALHFENPRGTLDLPLYRKWNGYYK